MLMSFLGFENVEMDVDLHADCADPMGLAFFFKVFLGVSGGHEFALSFVHHPI